MTQRIDYRTTASEFFEAMLKLHEVQVNSSMGADMLELVNIRASQINGCAWCLSLHIPGSCQAGIPTKKIDLVAVWPEADAIFTDRERSALAWTEALTLIGDSHAPDDVYDEVRSHFNEQETVELSWTVTIINAFNRMAVSMRRSPSHHR